MTDLSFPIFKLSERAAYERECLEIGTKSSGATGGGLTVSEVSQDQKDATRARAEACERAVEILKAAQSEAEK